MPAGARLAAAPHSHDHYEETIYGIRGVLIWKVNGNKFDVRPGEALRFRAARFTASITTGSWMVQGAARGAPYAGRNRPGVLPGVCRGHQRGGRWAARRAKLATIMRRYGLKPVLPPSA